MAQMSDLGRPAARLGVVLASFLTLWPLALAACGGSASTTASAEPTALRVVAGGIEIPATVHAADFERRLRGMPGYHLIVWGEGKSASAALFTTPVSDTAVLDAFEELGARPGNALGMDTWDERESPGSSAPDREIAGPAVEVLVRVPGRGEPLTLPEILDDPGGRGFDMRLGGHRANIHAWHSGCLVCLYSCPGSKVGNARYTVRDYVKGSTAFRVRPGVLPADGTAVTLLFRLR